MGRIKDGPFGPLVGKLGNTVGYVRFGQPILRMIGTPTQKPRSQKQKAVNEKFKIVSKFIKPINDFTNTGFRLDVLGTTKIAFNAAISYNLLRAVKGTYPDFELDYSKAIVSKGNLQTAENPTVELIPGLENNRPYAVKFKWDVDSDLDYKRRKDQVMMVAYLPDTERAYYSLSGARRPEGQDDIEVDLRIGSPNRPNDTCIETYIAFISDDRQSISDSIYAGKINLEA